MRPQGAVSSVQEKFTFCDTFINQYDISAKSFCLNIVALLKTKFINMKRLILLSLSILAYIFGNAQLLQSAIIDFETDATSVSFTCDNETYQSVDNPDKSGINTSEKVGHYVKNKGEWKYARIVFDSLVPIGNNNTLRFKVYCKNYTGRIFPKFWNTENPDNAVDETRIGIVYEGWCYDSYDFMPTVNTWVECELSLAGNSSYDNAQGKSFNILEIATCIDQGNNYDVDVYFDDIELCNPDAGDGTPFTLFNVSKTKLQADEQVIFDATNSYDYDGSIANYHWDFGDGSTIDTIAAIAHHSYSASGMYNVTLTTTDNDGKSSAKSTILFVIAANENISALKCITAEPKTYEKTEVVFQLANNYTNVYNPDEVKADATITNPDGTQYQMPCFYFINSICQKDNWEADSSYQSWMLRFTSDQVGEHKVKVTVSDRTGTFESNEIIVNFTKGEKHGFISRDSRNKQYYVYSDGTPFFPMGINHGWDNTSNYTKAITNLSNGKGNIERYWLTPFNRQALEWRAGYGIYKQGLGYYDQRPAGMCDYLIDLCCERDVYMQMVMFQHGEFSENVDAMWTDNPYNTANGGFVSRAEEFFYNDSCDYYIKKQLRYIIARWGYSPNVFAFEFFNEVQFAGNTNSRTAKWYPSMVAWHSRMSQYLQQIDPYNHLRTTSIDNSYMADFDTIPSLDVLQYHMYVGTTLIVPQQTKYDSELNNVVKNHALINGEYGSNDGTADTPFDTQRSCIWTSIMNQTPHFMWIWEHYLESSWANLFMLPSKYIDGEDFAGQGSLKTESVTVNHSQKLISSTLKTEQKNLYGYIYNPDYKQISDAKMIVPTMGFGYYDIYYYMPSTNETAKLENVPLVRNNNRFALPDFSGDIAFKIKYRAAYTNPIALAGEDTLVAPGNIIPLNGSNSFDPKGNSLTYKWELISKPEGSTAAIADASVAITSITPDVKGEFVVGLTVTADGVNSIQDVITITVSNQPIAVIDQGETLNVAKAKRHTYIDLSAKGSSDADGDALTYKWTIVEGTEIFSINDAEKEAIILQTRSEGSCKIQLVVNDGVSDSEPVYITVNVIDGYVSAIDGVTDNISIYPNPTCGILYIDNLSDGTSLIISNMQGQILKVCNYTNEKMTINFAELGIGNGIYVVSIYNAGIVRNYKIVYCK